MLRTSPSKLRVSPSEISKSEYFSCFSKQQCHGRTINSDQYYLHSSLFGRVRRFFTLWPGCVSCFSWTLLFQDFWPAFICETACLICCHHWGLWTISQPQNKSNNKRDILRSEGATYVLMEPLHDSFFSSWKEGVFSISKDLLLTCASTVGWIWVVNH